MTLQDAPIKRMLLRTVIRHGRNYFYKPTKRTVVAYYIEPAATPIRLPFKVFKDEEVKLAFVKRPKTKVGQ